ncbi:MAG: dihydrolipoamide acetyltransferase family protein, partial [Planctomycetota bacterium]
MRVEIVLPRLGESIAEGLIVRWLKMPGDEVQVDEPLLEVSTDKIDSEIPSPAAGVVVEVRAYEGETVAVNSVLAIVETGEEEAPQPKQPETEGVTPPPPSPVAEPPSPKPIEPTPQTQERVGPGVSPVVGRLAAEHGVDLSEVHGTGEDGRVTKRDVLNFIAAAPSTAASPPDESPADESPAVAPPTKSEGSVTREPMSAMRRTIASHMTRSRAVSAHVHSVFEADVDAMVALRSARNEEFRDQHGASLSYVAFFVRAVCDGLNDWPILNASIEEDTIVYKHDFNVGIAVATDDGLIVPVIQHADRLNVTELSVKIHDLAERSRTGKLERNEVQGA